MTSRTVEIHWPNGQVTSQPPGGDWLAEAASAGVSIPTGCLGGSCGACEIEVNGKIVRACISTVPGSTSGKLNVDFSTDPYW
ncbi:MAG: 2Fe-2S iron-sulfur cluster-binding protein [Synechococcus sp.]|nr:2Fe-2S iron-sulfur cluster-binding protein [Synechococcus sp.]